MSFFRPLCSGFSFANVDTYSCLLRMCVRLHIRELLHGCLFYPATDKVALIFGQSCYRGNSSPLPAVINDVYAMRKKLEEMQFKVISLVNLDLGEMRNAVSWFCEMLSAGAYGAWSYLFTPTVFESRDIISFR